MEEDKNYINMIHGDLARASQVQSGMPENVGVMNIKTANRPKSQRHVRCGIASGMRGNSPVSLPTPMWASPFLPYR
jgi:hypothetical protein